MYRNPFKGIFVAVWLVYNFTTVFTNSFVINTKLGKLEGLTLSSRSGRLYHAFRGIQYAQAHERFQIADPVKKPWDGIRKASAFGDSCPHLDVLSKTVIGKDECLFLNVYSKVEGELKPVMIFFHPGGFELGRSDDFDAKYFMDEDVVLVTLNYRLGALGFLSTEDEIAPGNFGLKDQNIALHWVQNNIEAFGGDKTRVNIFGESAGGASVHYHILSSSSKGLFHNAISQSGSANSPWAYQQNPRAIANTFGKFLNCPTATSQELIDCLKTKTTAELVLAQLQFKRWSVFPFNTFAPTVEPKSSPKPFLTDLPYSIMTSGKFNQVPWIIGFTEDEGVSLSPLIIMNENLTKEINEDWNRVAPIVLMYDSINPNETKDEISGKILDFYFGDQEEIGEETWDSLTDMLSDRISIHPADTAARLHAKYAPVYPYVFAFPGTDSTSLRAFWGISGDFGVGHMDELQYLFNGLYGSPEYVDEIQHEPLELSQNFVRLWKSFAESSIPTATWKGIKEWKSVPNKIGNKPIKYYQIASRTIISDTDLKERMKFWNDLPIDTATIIKTEQNKKEEL